MTEHDKVALLNMINKASEALQNVKYKQLSLFEGKKVQNFRNW